MQEREVSRPLYLLRHTEARLDDGRKGVLAHPRGEHQEEEGQEEDYHHEDVDDRHDDLAGREPHLRHVYVQVSQSVRK